jgi:hypothetical protein
MMWRNRFWSGWLCCGAIGLLYLGSFFLPAWEDPNCPAWREKGRQHSGFEAFSYSWGVVERVSSGPDVSQEHPLMEHALIAWLANPLLWVGLVMFALGRNGEAMVLGLWAFLLGLTALLGLMGYDYDSATPLLGYCLWLGCMVLLIAAGAACHPPTLSTATVDRAKADWS